MTTIAGKWLQQGYELGYNAGVRISLLDNLRSSLETKFGFLGLYLWSRIILIEELTILRNIEAAFRQNASLQELRQICEEGLTQKGEKHTGSDSVQSI